MTRKSNVDKSDWPDWLLEASRKPVAVECALSYTAHSDQYRIATLEGEQTVSWGDYIIQGVQGEIYPCKPDIFEATYDKVDEP